MLAILKKDTCITCRTTGITFAIRSTQTNIWMQLESIASQGTIMDLINVVSQYVSLLLELATKSCIGCAVSLGEP